MRRVRLHRGFPLRKGLLDLIGGNFAVLCFGAQAAAGLAALADDPTPIDLLSVTAGEGGPGTAVIDSGERLARHLGAAPGSVFLFRPDQHLCAAWPSAAIDAVRAARDRAIGLATQTAEPAGAES